MKKIFLIATIILGLSTTSVFAVSQTINLAAPYTWTAKQTFSNASTTLGSFSYASSTLWYGGGWQSCDPTTGKLTWANGIISCGTDFNTGGAGGSGTVGTSTNETAGTLSYWTSNSATPALLGKVSTTTLTLSGFPASIPSTYGKLVGGSDTTWTWWGLATTTALSSSNVLYSTNGAAGVSGIATGTVSSSGGITTTASRYVLNGNLAISCDVASGSIAGCLSTTDWNTFNGKESVLTFSTPLVRIANNISWTGLATTSQPTSSNLLVSNGGAGVYGVATTSVGCSGFISCTGFNALGAASTITTTGQLSVASGGTGLSTFGGVNTILYTTAADTLSSEAAFLYNPTANRLTVDYASTTAISTSNASTTNFTISGLGGASTRCLEVTTNGTVQANASGCGGTGSQTPWTSNIDGAGFNLSNVGLITGTVLSATSTTATSTITNSIAIATSTANSTVEIQGSFHIEEKELSTSTAMVYDFCDKVLGNNTMDVGASNITFTFNSYNKCPGKRVTLKIRNPNTGPVASTTFIATKLYWDGYVNPGNNTTNGGMDEFTFTSTNGTSTPFIWATLNSSLP